MLREIRYAVRALWLNKVFALVAILCLAFGIGINTTIFSVVDGVLLKPFDFRDPERLVVLHDRHVKSGENNNTGIGWPNYLDLRQSATSYSEIAACGYRSLTLSDGEEPERFAGSLIDANLFSMLGVTPALGRNFREEENRPGAPGVVLLSDELWKRRYNGDRGILGRSILVNGKASTVVGVMPPRFKFPENQMLWVPLAPLVQQGLRTDRNITVFARLKSGVTLARANAEAKSIAATLATDHPAENQGWTTTVRTLRREFIPPDVRLVILAMMGAVTCVLLIACANVANLMLARAASRHREIAIRSAIGAGRGRIVRQLLTESVVVALAGGALGIIVAHWGLNLLDAAIPAENKPPYYIHWSIDGVALTYTLVISMLTGIVFGLAPALQTAHGNLQDALKEGVRGTGAGGRRNKLRSTLVIAEVAMSLVLLVAAALFVRSFMAINSADSGLDESRLMTMRVYLPGDPYNSDDAKRQRLEDLVRRIEGLPGVEAATASNTIMMGGGGNVDGVIAEGVDVPHGEEPQLFFAGVTAHWFKTHGIPILKGRDFSETEASDSSAVAVVNLAFAKKLWPKQDPIGRRFRLLTDPSAHWITVIGTTKNVNVGGLDDKDNPAAAFLPYLYVPARNNGITIRVQGDPARIVPGARREIHAADPGLPLFDVWTMRQVRERDYWQFGLFSKMFTVFGALALLLALVGVYGVISYGVGQRTHEIGVRMALGARSEDVLRMIVGQGIGLAGIGIGVGLLGAFGAGRVLSSLLWGTSPADPVSFATIALLLTATAAAASWFPARRAAAVDPMVALREE